MVGALSALKAERARFRHELTEYRREAAKEREQALRYGVNVAPVERPEPGEELQGLLTDIVQKSQERRLKRKKQNQGAPKSSDAVWKDVSNVLGSSERHLPVAEKYFKRVFDLIRDPDSVPKGKSIWKDGDENEAEEGRSRGSEAEDSAPGSRGGTLASPGAPRWAARQLLGRCAGPP